MYSKSVSGALIAVVAGVVLAGPANAHSATQIRQEAIEKRGGAQAEAIVSGRKDGSLTWWERARLVREQRRITKLEGQVLADGRITKGEYLAVKAAQNDARDHIKADEHNQYVRGWWWRTFGR